MGCFSIFGAENRRLYMGAGSSIFGPENRRWRVFFEEASLSSKKPPTFKTPLCRTPPSSKNPFIFEEPLLMFNLRSSAPKTIEPPPSSIFGAEDWFEDRHRLRGGGTPTDRFAQEKSETCRVQNTDIPRVGRVGAPHGGAAGQGGSGLVGTPAGVFALETTVPQAFQGFDDNCSERFFKSTSKRNPM